MLRGLLGGAVAWLVGFVLTLVAGVAGLYGPGGFSGTATAYLRAHAVPPATSVRTKPTSHATAPPRRPRSNPSIPQAKRTTH